MVGAASGELLLPNHLNSGFLCISWVLSGHLQTLNFNTKKILRFIHPRLSSLVFRTISYRLRLWDILDDQCRCACELLHCTALWLVPPRVSSSIFNHKASACNRDKDL